MSRYPSRSSGYVSGLPRRSAPRTPERRSPDRRAWITMFEYALKAFDAPSETPYDFANSLRGLTGDNFPVERGDIRARWAKSFLERARLWVDGGASTRTAFAAGLAADAKAFTDFLIEQGAAQAAASRQRMGMED
ncbi:hypothetical protein CA606_18420 [Caulobacter vibrioides]|uniref:Uncharacterized protein n=1 Tax=Caulobacter vibrioides TaxID=155892 RepID=A0A290MPX8_CAUVI|nr:hypothetical protein [Caulobacter vibrioides]ATC34147.1 hypothetical protein CA606_18420 [Caulobacter vibrioides]